MESLECASRTTSLANRLISYHILKVCRIRNILWISHLLAEQDTHASRNVTEKYTAK